MAGLTDAARAAAVAGIKNSVVYAQLHTGAAGASGTSNIATGGRKIIVWGTVTPAGELNISSPLNFTGGASNGAVHSVTLWSALIGGTFYGEFLITGSSTFDSSGLYTLTSLQIRHTPPPIINLGMSQTDKDAVDLIVEQSMASSLGHQPGALVWVDGPMGVYKQAYGKTASLGGREVTIDDHFRLASVTKALMAQAILKHIGLGQLSLSNTLSTYVSGVPNGSTITIQNMMMMRSGVFDEQQDSSYLSNFIAHPSTGGTWTETSSLNSVKNHASQFTPGTSFQYTNSNYRLLGYCLEAVLSKTIKQILIDDVITPLGLTETVWPDDAVIPVPAMHTNLLHPIFTGAAGALTGNMDNMVKLGRAVINGTLLTPALHSQQMTTMSFYPYNPSTGISEGPPTFGYGLGMVQIGSWFGHDGSLPATGTAMMCEPYTGSVICVAENKQTSGLQAMSRIWHRIANHFYNGSADTVNFFA